MAKKKKPVGRPPKKKEEPVIFGRHEVAPGSPFHVEVDGKTVLASRASQVHIDDLLMRGPEIGDKLLIERKNWKAIMAAANAELIVKDGLSEYFWSTETLLKVAKFLYQTSKERKKLKAREMTALEKTRHRRLLGQIAKDEENWIPKDVALVALASHQQQAASIFKSVVPNLRRKHPDVPVSVLKDIEADLMATYNLSCNLELDESGIEVDNDFGKQEEEEEDLIDEYGLPI